MCSFCLTLWLCSHLPGKTEMDDYWHHCWETEVGWSEYLCVAASMVFRSVSVRLMRRNCIIILLRVIAKEKYHLNQKDHSNRVSCIISSTPSLGGNCVDGIA
jgi:hypothetical protein